MLADTVPIEDIKYKDTESYFGILYKNNSWKQICRINLDTRKKQLLIPDENKKFILSADITAIYAKFMQSIQPIFFTYS